jgi:hypothetical protein
VELGEIGEDCDALDVIVTPTLVIAINHKSPSIHSAASIFQERGLSISRVMSIEGCLKFTT